MDDQSSQNVVIKTTPGSYFYSDSINLLPNQSLSLNLTALSPTEINDIYEGIFFMGTLVSGQRELVRLFHERNKGGGCVNPGGEGSNPGTTIINNVTQAVWATTDW